MDNEIREDLKKENIEENIDDLFNEAFLKAKESEKSLGELGTKFIILINQLKQFLANNDNLVIADILEFIRRFINDSHDSNLAFTNLLFLKFVKKHSELKDRIDKIEETHLDFIEGSQKWNEMKLALINKEKENLELKLLLKEKENEILTLKLKELELKLEEKLTSQINNLSL